MFSLKEVLGAINAIYLPEEDTKDDQSEKGAGCGGNAEGFIANTLRKYKQK